ncbi:MAG: UTP--glucose-1-phosphate uridylyltransferase [Elusimicrobiota bacterium]
MSLEHPLLKEYHYPAAEIERLIESYRTGNLKQENNIISGMLKCPAEDDFISLPPVPSGEYGRLKQRGIESISKGELGIVILNGGMGTRFGGLVKGAVEVFDGLSFLELKIKETSKVSPEIKLFIMNSFATSAKTEQLLNDKGYFGVPGSIKMFNQYIAPRIDEKGSYLRSETGIDAFYGPGHGDFPYAFRDSGLLDEFLSSGGKYIFFSNVDNLGARVAPVILGFHIEQNCELTAEVALKDPGDEGGAPAIVDGKLQLVEGFCFPENFDQSQIPVFNCSTYWVNAESLKKDFSLPWYLVKKQVAGQDVIQFEHLAGDMTKFLSTLFLKVARKERFYPIKRPEDLEEKRQVLKKILGF